MGYVARGEASIVTIDKNGEPFFSFTQLMPMSVANILNDIFEDITLTASGANAFWDYDELREAGL